MDSDLHGSTCFTDHPRPGDGRHHAGRWALLWLGLGLATSAAGEGAGQSPVGIYRETCVGCHQTGANGAPRPGMAADWEPRLTYGREALYYSAIDGVPPHMPARGLCMRCTDEELMAVVDYMLNARPPAAQPGEAPPAP